MSTGYQWAKKNKTAMLKSEMTAKRGNKYRAVKVELDGHTFDSKAEAKRYGELKLLEKAGCISRLQVHPRFDLFVQQYLVATYKPDFTYWDDITKCHHVEDVKSPPTARKRDFILIRKLMKAIHGIDVQIIGARSPASPPIRKAA